MLRTAARVLVVLACVFAGVTAPVGVGPAAACPPGSNPVTDADGGFQYEDSNCSETGDPEDPSTPSTGGGRGEIRCYWVDREVSCTSESGLGVWNGECYVKVVESAPEPESDYFFLWEGHDGGYVILCTPWPCEAYADAPEAFPGYGCGAEYSWQQDAPAVVGVEGPTPLELAERAVVAMDLDMGEIGSTPPSTEVKGDSVGVVGAPVWLWVADPAENTTGPITRVESDGGLTVTATGTLDRVEWTLTDDDGEVYRELACSGEDAAGTRWTEGLGVGPSPTCGFDGQENSRSGRLTVSGTAYWTVEWTSTGTDGADGTIDIPGLERSTTLAVGEVQVLLQ